MSEQVQPASAAELRADTDALRDALAAAAVAVPGVARLEPTLRNALRRLQAGTTVLRDAGGVRSAADGIELRRRAQVVDVHVDVATDGRRSAADAAQAVREALRGVVAGRGLEPGALTVAVLSIEQ